MSAAVSGRRCAAALCVLLALATSASAECPGGVWGEAPAGSDQWRFASVPKSQFGTEEECQRQADNLNAFELTMVKAQRAGRDARDVFTCFPCGVDPRPEAALLHEGAGPRGSKGK